MHSTRKKIVILACTIFTTAGCADAAKITAPTRTVPGSSSFDVGGGWFGTGNRTDSTTTTTSAPAASQNEAELGTAADGGGWFGSGN